MLANPEFLACHRHEKLYTQTCLCDVETKKKHCKIYSYSVIQLILEKYTSVELVLLFHTLAFCCQLKVWKLLQWSEWCGAISENRNFQFKEGKATTQILNLNTKTIEHKHFIHYLERFLQSLSVCFRIKWQHLNTSITDEPLSAKDTCFGALSQGLCTDWLVCIASCIFGIWLAQTSCPIFS